MGPQEQPHFSGVSSALLVGRHAQHTVAGIQPVVPAAGANALGFIQPIIEYLCDTLFVIAFYLRFAFQQELL